ncbi:carbohydrate ABC transporter substrate-binding protein [Leptolyngbyaceae cyanobacterium CCMR0082]|uniref:Carbohydrate ABC transporter substrate-binding protein n=2 Tax=Adonisia turfae TaxID=2950184 RepID=A0A6M0SE92_9CYAN|nr:ABC transporter substrate-binding protein [Adonisia turfae]NEZ55913.1 carbohydrate ABC transporter substrate-binding protein [Adonisia turfae CCMR0081]NEZ65982.1 carbohydrate ABC transporter substrate-binding protein [Adonisia turfae CCMR0082]
MKFTPRSLHIVSVLSLLLTACNGNSQNNSSDTLVILGSLTGVGQEIVEEAFAPFTAETGIEVVYEGTDAFSTVLPIRVAGGDVPDLAIFPQPGLMRDLAREGALTPLNDIVELPALTAAFGPDWVDLGTVDEQVYGLWMRSDPKSLVWYNPDAFEAAGYNIPQSWDELIGLTERIAADGKTPWCFGLESGEATGWVGTDWVEDILLRTAGTEVYDQWVAHEIPFNSPPVKEAFQMFGDIVRNDRYVRGGVVGAISTPFGDAPAPMFDQPPGCYLHRQASFITDFLPDTVEPGKDTRVFLLPGDGPQSPLLTGGLVIAITNNSPAAQAAINYLTTVTPHESWAARGYISPHQEVDLAIYPNDGVRQMAAVLTQAETIRFDGSDLMPAAVGTGTFWAEMVNYISGTDVDTVLSAIDASWPEE